MAGEPQGEAEDFAVSPSGLGADICEVHPEAKGAPRTKHLDLFWPEA